MIYLLDFLFVLPPKTFVRILFDDSPTAFCFTTGKKNTVANVGKLRNEGRGGAWVREVIPLWHAQEVYIRCGG